MFATLYVICIKVRQHENNWSKFPKTMVKFYQMLKFALHGVNIERNRITYF